MIWSVFVALVLGRPLPPKCQIKRTTYNIAFGSPSMVTRDKPSNMERDHTLACDKLLTIASNTPNANASNHNERVNLHKSV